MYHFLCWLFSQTDNVWYVKVRQKIIIDFLSYKTGRKAFQRLIPTLIQAKSFLYLALYIWPLCWSGHLNRNLRGNKALCMQVACFSVLSSIVFLVM